MLWKCVDGRWFEVFFIASFDRLIYDFEARLNPIAPNPTSTSMHRNEGRGYKMNYVLPSRRAGEIEDAIGRLGPTGSKRLVPILRTPGEWYQ
jgi:hypothetical protein